LFAYINYFICIILDAFLILRTVQRQLGAKVLATVAAGKAKATFALAAIALFCAHVAKDDPEGIVAFLTSDHVKAEDLKKLYPQAQRLGCG
jgi:hypothetical protein